MNWHSAIAAFNHCTRTLRHGDNMVSVTMTDGTVVIVAEGKAAEDLRLRVAMMQDQWEKGTD